MTTQLNEHQYKQILIDYITTSIGIFSEARRGNFTLERVISEFNKFDLDKLNEAFGLLVKAEVRG